MAECTSGNLTALALDTEESNSLAQLLLDHLDEVHSDPHLEEIALAMGVV